MENLMKGPSLTAVMLCASVLITSGAEAVESQDASSKAAFTVHVLKGEDAVNVIQRKTAVAPVVEVRDRNNLPLPGVSVTFTIGGGQAASFGGASTLTVTTNAAGQAVAAGFTPSAVGALQINATAVFQGQAVVATITQTNVLTAAEAAAAAGNVGGGAGAATGPVSSAGGGLSATTLGIVGGAVAGGALVAKESLGGDTPSASAAQTTFEPSVAITSITPADGSTIPFCNNSAGSAVRVVMQCSIPSSVTRGFCIAFLSTDGVTTAGGSAGGTISPPGLYVAVSTPIPFDQRIAQTRFIIGRLQGTGSDQVLAQTVRPWTINFSGQCP